MSGDLHAEFLKLHMAHHKALFGYLLTAVHDFERAEDLHQEVTLVLWKKFGQYRRSSPYLSWAFGVARREVAYHFRKSGRKETALPLEILDSMAAALENDEGRLSEESRTLASCVEKLPEDHRQLVSWRYEEGSALRSLADRLGLSLPAINMKLVRIRRVLLDCVEHSLAGGT